VQERVHGGIREDELRSLALDAAHVVDFSVNLNPYGPCERLVHAALSARLDRYPDPHAHAARAAWASALGRDPSHIAVGHGASELLWLLMRALLAPRDRVVIAEPTFSEMRVAAASCGARIERVQARADDGYAFDVGTLVNAAQAARAIYVCSPNNPTGSYLAPEQVRVLAKSAPETIVILDQSFLTLSEHAADLREAFPDNVVCVRSLTKDFACPGLRIGLCIANERVIELIEQLRPTWATSAPALAAIEVSAVETNFVQQSWQRMRVDRDAVTGVLRKHGLTPLPSVTAYQIAAVPLEAALLRRHLLAQGVLVRDCASFGLPRFIRVAALPERERLRLDHAFAHVQLSRASVV